MSLKAIARKIAGAVAGALLTTVICPAQVNTDSLEAVFPNARGIEKMKAGYDLATAFNLVSFEKTINYAMEAVTEGQRILASDSAAGMPGPRRDEVRKILMLCYNSLAWGYYREAYAKNDENVQKNAVSKMLGYADDIDAQMAMLNDREALLGAEPTIYETAPYVRILAYMLNGNHKEALRLSDELADYYRAKSLHYYEAKTLQGKANVFIGMNDMQNALKCLERSAEILKLYPDEQKVQHFRIALLENLAAINVNIGNYDEGQRYIKETLQLAEPLGDYTVMSFCYEGLMEIAEAKGDWRRALECHRLYVQYNDSVFNREKAEQLAAAEVRFETAQKQSEIERLQRDKEIQELESTRMRVIMLLLLVGAAFLIYYGVTRKRTATMLKAKNDLIEARNQEIETQNKALQEQNETIQKQNAEIKEKSTQLDYTLRQLTESVDYASLLQNQVMRAGSTELFLSDKLFIYFRPKEAVSGDFYYARRVAGWNIVAACDCTGHGVSGALLTMLGISFFNDFVAKITAAPQTAETLLASDILESLREAIKETLTGMDDETISMSGMDIALLLYREGELELQFAGANRPLYLMKDGELQEFKGVRAPIANYIDEKPFQTERIAVSPGDCAYVFSDGITDMRSADLEKYKPRRLRDAIKKVQGKHIKEQGEALTAEFRTFINGGEAEQMDDALLIGVEI